MVFMARAVTINRFMDFPHRLEKFYDESIDVSSNRYSADACEITDCTAWLVHVAPQVHPRPCDRWCATSRITPASAICRTVGIVCLQCYHDLDKAHLLASFFASQCTCPNPNTDNSGAHYHLVEGNQQ